MEACVKYKKYAVMLLSFLAFVVLAYFFNYSFYSQDIQQGIEQVVFDQAGNFNLVEDVAVDVPQHLFEQLSQTVFYTPQERKQFFDQLGIDYCNETVIEYEPLFDYDIKVSKQYLTNPDEYDRLTDVYDDDIVLQTLMPMSIRWINEQVGHGVFAEDDLPAGGFIGIYGGVVKDRNLVHDKDYAWAYPQETLQGGRMTLDAKEKGNELRLINDGKDPNCVVKYIPGSDGLWHVCYIAQKDIKKGDQLLISYGPAYWETRKYGYQELAD